MRIHADPDPQPCKGVRGMLSSVPEPAAWLFKYVPTSTKEKIKQAFFNFFV